MTQITLREALQSLNVSQLQGLCRCLREPVPKVLKAGLVDFLRDRLLRKSMIEKVLRELDSLELSALAEAVHRGDGGLDLDRFQAKYEKVPKSLNVLAFRPDPNAPSPIMVLIYGGYPNYFVPREFIKPLCALIDRPQSVTISSVEDLPKSIRRRKLIIHYSEQIACRELGPVLRLVQQGAVKLTSKKRLPAKGTQEKLSEHLVNGDHYPDKGTSRYEQTGSIRAFAWPLLLQAASLARTEGDKLVLTTAGLEAMSRRPANTLKSMWKAWLKWRDFDEFSRVDSIRGQHHGPGGLTRVKGRREVLVRALAECPVGQWVAVTDFIRFMQVEGFIFEVCHDPWSLYVEDPRHGSLGYDGFHGWNVLQKRYVSTVLFEYAATLGLVDLAHIHPAAAEIDHELWGADCLPFLSRYDGLQYFRINALGAWSLGMARCEDAPNSNGSLRLMPSLLVNAAKGASDPQVEMMLDTWASREGESCWRLNKARMIEALENGHDLDGFHRFLTERDDQPLPESVEALFKSCRAQAGAVHAVGPALVYECRDKTTCATIAKHPEMAGLCQPVGDKRLVVSIQCESRFREALRIIGFGLRQS